jgi:hypothetical protein
MSETNPELKARAASERRDDRWQKSMSPWLLTFISVLAAFFLGASYLQFKGLAEHIAPDTTPTSAATMEWAREAAQADSGSDPVVLQTMILASMATDSTAQRYGLAKVGLMSAVWLRYLGFVTGMIMALMGAAFLGGRVKDADGGTEIEGESALWKGSIRSASPGLLLAAMGSLLMITAMLNNFEVAVEDGGLPAAAANAASTSVGAQPSLLNPSDLGGTDAGDEAATQGEFTSILDEAAAESI